MKNVRSLSALLNRSIFSGPRNIRLTPFHKFDIKNASKPSIFGLNYRSLFLQTETTPNPNSLKFKTGADNVLPKEFGMSMAFHKTGNFSNSPLAKRLFRIEGIEGVMFGEDFVSVTKNDQIQWMHMKPAIFECLMDFFQSNKEAVLPSASEMDNSEQSEGAEVEDEIIELIKEILDERVRPMVQEDGGDIYFKSWDEKEGIVVVQLAGACEGCPSSLVTLKSGVENMLMYYIPEVKRVEQFYEEEELNARTLQWKPSD